MTCVADYSEDEQQLINDVEYNVGLLDMKVQAFRQLAGFLREQLGQRQKIFHADIGCNIGVLVNVFSEAGFNSTGYDLNNIAIEKGRSLFLNVELISTPVESDGRQYDLLTAIDVLEHIKIPTEFFRSVLACLKPGGHLFVVVPRVDRDSWKHLTEDTVEQMTFNLDSPFRDNDVHVVHYSSNGLAAIGRLNGLEVVADFNDRPWPMNGMLFRKPSPKPMPIAALQKSKVRSAIKHIIAYRRRLMKQIIHSPQAD